MKRLLAVAAVCAMGLGASTASAAPVQGSFKIDGDVNLARVGSDYIDFGPIGGGTGDFAAIASAATGSFIGLTEGTIGDLFGLGVGTVNVPMWLQFDTKPNWNFTLTDIYPGAGELSGCDNTVGGVPCTPPGSPFTLTNIRNANPPIPAASSVSMTVSGFVLNELNERSVFTLTFTSQLDDLSAAGALNRIEDEGYVQSSWSAEGNVFPDRVPPPVPEPASLALMGLAFAGMGVAIRRRR